MTLLAETEGIWAETAGGVTLAVAQKLIEQGRIDRDGSTVLCITGNGLKTQEALLGKIARPVVIKPEPRRIRGPGRAGRPPRSAVESRRRRSRDRRASTPSPDVHARIHRTQIVTTLEGLISPMPTSSHSPLRFAPTPAASTRSRPQGDRRRGPRPRSATEYPALPRAHLRRRRAAPVRQRLCQQRRHPLSRRPRHTPSPTKDEVSIIPPSPGG